MSDAAQAGEAISVRVSHLVDTTVVSDQPVRLRCIPVPAEWDHNSLFDEPSDEDDSE